VEEASAGVDADRRRQVGDLDRLTITEQEGEAGFPEQTGGVEGGQKRLHDRIVSPSMSDDRHQQRMDGAHLMPSRPAQAPGRRPRIAAAGRR
jgi:hypothetical protein